MPEAAVLGRRSRRQAGIYDRRLTIQGRASTQRPGQFEADVVWTTHSRPWASRSVVRGAERYEADQFASRVDVVLHLSEYVEGLIHTMRILLTERDGRTVTYDISAILPPERDGEGQEVHVYEHAD